MGREPGRIGMVGYRFAAVLLALFFCATSAAGTEKIVIDGSTGVMPLAAALAKAYQAEAPDIVELGRGMNPSDRLRAVADGTIDIALASHGLTAADLARHGLVAHTIAKIAVVFGVNDSVRLTSLTEQQVCDLYAGKISDWQALGHAPLPMAPRARPESEVDTEVVRARIPCLRDLKFPEAVKLLAKSGDMARELAGTPGAIGFTTMTVVEQSRGRIRAVMLNGIAPTADNVRAGAYTLTRDSMLVTRAEPSAAVRRLIDFVRSPRGAETIAANGAIPVK